MAAELWDLLLEGLWFKLPNIILLSFFPLPLDRHSGASAEVQKEEEKKFKEVGEAFSVLSDAKKKSRYDTGQDLEDDGMNMGGEHMGRLQCVRSQGWSDWNDTRKFSQIVLCSCRFLCFLSFQILMPTTFSRHSLEVQGVLVSKVTYVLFESKNLSLCQPFGRSPTIWEYPKCANGFVFFIIFSIWTWKFLLPVWLIGRVDYLNSYYIRTFQQCQPHNPSSVFNNWLICKSVSCICHWLNECNPMQQMPV